MDHYGRGYQAADGCGKKILEITRFRYLVSPPGFGACGPRGFYGGSLLGHPRGDWKHTFYLHNAGKNPAENCCLWTCLMFILVVKSYVSLHRLYIFSVFFLSYHPESRISKHPWLACYVPLLGLTWKWSKRSHISWEWKLPSRDHGQNELTKRPI